MKKFVIIALIFALAAGAAFAQDWSVSGTGEIGTMLNFAGDKDVKDQQQGDKDGFVSPWNSKPNALIGAHGYNNIRYYGYIGAQMSVRYNNGGLSTGLNFFPTAQWGDGDHGLWGVINYASENSAFGMSYRLNALLTADIGNPHTSFADGLNGGRLWGWYKFLDGQIKVEAAVRSADVNYWYSNNTVFSLFGQDGEMDYVFNVQTKDGKHWDATFGKGFADPDGHNYLLAEIKPEAVSGLSFGVMIPSVFVYTGATGNNKLQNPPSYASNNGTTGYVKAQGRNSHIDFLDDALLRSRVGVQYAAGPVNIAAQFALLSRDYKWKKTTEKENDAKTVPNEIVVTALEKDEPFDEINGVEFPNKKKTLETGLYLGVNYSINDNLKAGLSFQGEFYSQRPQLGVGANVGFGTGPLSAGLGLGLYTAIDPTEHVVFATKKTDPYPKTVTLADGTTRNFSGLYDFEEDLDPDKNSYKVKKMTESYFAINPDVTFKIVENYLAASLDTSLYWRFGVQEVDGFLIHERKFQQDVFGYEITPALWFNVAGTGAAKSYWGTANLIIVRYKVAGWVDGSERRAMNKIHTVYENANSGPHVTRPVYNAVDVTFKWSF